ncbi:MAG: lytic transglycosylase domain-containing protein [Ruminococcus sp.]|nr:lytic transglycosylase domain-containing protein [Ruminococcus sp.]
MAKSKSKKKNKPSALRIAFIVIILLIIVLGLMVIFKDAETENRAKKFFTYPTDYEEYVIKYSNEYGMDPRFVFAIIYTESHFNADAESDVGARGLMQIMSDAFDWIEFKLDDDRGLTFDDMYEPEYNIQYGTYMLSYLYDKFGTYELTAAAYHQGMNAVQGWIDDGTIDPEHFSIDENLDDMPSSATQNYIYKVMKAYEKYSDNSQLEEDIENGTYE